MVQQAALVDREKLRRHYYKQYLRKKASRQLKVSFRDHPVLTPLRRADNAPFLPHRTRLPVRRVVQKVPRLQADPFSPADKILFTAYMLLKLVMAKASKALARFIMGYLRDPVTLMTGLIALLRCIQVSLSRSPSRLAPR